MNLRQLEYFVTIAHLEHMTKAAEQLKTSQPNISHAMTALEEELEVALFEKKGRNITLTRFGRIFLTYIEPALQEITKGQKVLAEMSHPEKGAVEFGFIYTIGANLAPLLIRLFLQDLQNQKIKFGFHQGSSKQIVESLVNGTIDIGICSKIENEETIDFEILTQEEIVLVVPENHPLAKKKTVHLKDTEAYSYVYYAKQSGLRAYLDEVLETIGLKPTIVCELIEDHSVLGFVANGYGIALMPNIRSIHSYPVKQLEIVDQLPERNIYLATKKLTPKTPAVQKFYDFCINEFK